jgi:hypothetical protein
MKEWWRFGRFNLHEAHATIEEAEIAVWGAAAFLFFDNRLDGLQ